MEKQVVKSKNKTIFLALVALLLICTLILSFFLLKDGAVARVGDETISMDELNETLVEQYGKAALETMITNKMIELEASKEKVKISEEEQKRELQALIDSYGGAEAFEEAVKENGMNQEAIEKEIKHYITIKKLMEPRITITEEEMKSYFEENKSSFDEPEQVKASHILVKDKATAEEIVEKLSTGADFSALAKQYSTDTSNSETGGDLGYFGRGEMVAEFEEVAFSLAVNKISEPVKTEFGYHIIQVHDKKAAKEAVYLNHAAEIKNTLFEERLQTEYSVWVEELTNQYKIENLLNAD
jgi:foldase protein PrsA